MRLVPTLKLKRKLLMQCAIYHTRLFPTVFNFMPGWVEAKDRFAFAMGMAPLVKPIDPVGRMPQENLDEWNRAMGRA